MEQQKNAFFKLGLDKESLEDFWNSFQQYKSKNPPEFPEPDIIYHKKFPFLANTLINLQKDTKIKPKEKAKEILEDVKKIEPKKNSPSKFGVELTEKEEPEEPIIIPEPIQSILDKYKQIGSKELPSDFSSPLQIHLIDSLSLSLSKEVVKKTPEAPLEKWIEDLLNTDESPKENHNTHEKHNNPCSFSSGPLLDFPEYTLSQDVRN